MHSPTSPKSYRLGVMQGRLLPKYRGRYQAHPVGYWQDEFPLAQRLGLDCIEFILDFEDYEKNPLLGPAGIAAIQAAVAQTGVKVETVCADLFMEAPLHAADRALAELALQIARELIRSASQLGTHTVVLPCVDQSSLRSDEATDRLIQALGSLLPLARENKVTLALEADLGPAEFRKLLTRVDSPELTVNYDTGNSASLGFDPKKELDAYGARITDVHIKDRALGGGPVMLGTGHADIRLVLTELRRLRYEGPFILQAWRDDEGVTVLKQQLELTRALFEECWV